MDISLGPGICPPDPSLGKEFHFESPALVWINEEILERSGGSWDRPPERLRPSRWDYWRCRRFLWDFSGNRIASFKDPRTILTYSMWRELLPDHSVIACLRHPMNVAESLRTRDGWPIARGLDLWMTYNLKLLGHVRRAPRVYWLDFDSGREGLEALVGRIRADFQLPRCEAALEHYNPIDHHHRLDDRKALPPPVDRIYQELNALAGNRLSDRLSKSAAFPCESVRTG
jgi:hypothetical protein